jgi:DNA-binding NtrC family response regulator
MLTRNAKPKFPRPAEPLYVFLAEDDRSLRATIALLLRRDGHRVVEARDGIDLLVDISESGVPPDQAVVVTDLRMPMIGGLAVLRSLSRETRRPAFIVMTAFATPAIRQEVAQLGAVMLFDKPFDLDQLRRVVAEISVERRIHKFGAREDEAPRH